MAAFSSEFGLAVPRHNSVVTLGVWERHAIAQITPGKPSRKSDPRARQRRAPRCTKAWDNRFTVWF